MNCNQARAMLAAYRELKDEEVDTIELDVHLEGCTSCRQELARYTFVGKQVRSMSVIEPSPDMHTKLMQALAKEQIAFIQRSAPGTVSTPDFLKPYLQEHAQSTHSLDLVATFSTAETGPLPIIQAKRKHRARSHMSQFAVLGLAAAFLMVIMMGGLTSLLLLAHNNPGTPIDNNTSSINRFAEVVPVNYATHTSYQHVVSAVADRSYIYYTAYQEGADTAWMLERLDRTTKLSVPLLSAANADRLLVLGSSNGSLVWLQFDGLKLKPHKNLPSYNLHPYVNQWSLRYLSPEQQQQAALGIPTDSEILLKGSFDQDTAPTWAGTPVQGIWFTQDSLLVATIDNNGISHLMNIRLGTAGKPSATEIATAPTGHILTSPTANSDGTRIYWSEEWFSNAGILNSNIWTQQQVDAARPTHGRWAGYTERLTIKQLFISDGMAFHPQVVDNALFMLSTASPANTAQGTPTATGTTATPVPASPPNTTGIPRVNTSIFAAPLDGSVRGTILMLPLNVDPTTLPTAMSTSGTASSLQVGTDFALWQDDKGYEMYDVAGGYVTVGNTLDGASFVAVNGASAVWMVSNGGTVTPSNAGSPVTLTAFNWPK